MSDEEKRLKEIKEKIPETPMIQESIENEVEIQSEIKVVNIEPEEKKKVKITGLSFFDEKGELKSVFATGEDLNVKVYFTVHDQDISLLNFGLSLYSQENLYILGINTIIDKVDTGQYVLKGYFEVKYPKIQLTSNYYYFKASVFEDNDNKMFDFMHKSEDFIVISKSLNQGAFQMLYYWV